MSNTVDNSKIETNDLYIKFVGTSIKDLENCLLNGASREEKIFYRKLLNLKLQLAQEKVIGELLL